MTSSKTLGILAALAIPAASQAATLRVPSEYPTIQAGIDAAAVADTVLVAPGTYADYQTRPILTGSWTSCVFLKGGVVVRSEAGSASTTVHMPVVPAQPSVVYGEYLATDDSAFEGFTITSVPLFASSTWIINSGRVAFRDCVFRDLVGFITNAGLNVNNGDVDVIGCRFINCQTSGGSGLGAAIYHDDGRIEVRDSHFEDCSSRAVWVDTDDTGSEARVENCEFVNCRGNNGGALNLHARPAGTVVSGCRFIGNVDTGTGGGALNITGLGPKVVEDCLFLFNQTIGGNGRGGAVRVAGATTVRRCTFVGNHQLVADTGGSGIAFRQGSSGSRLENNILYGCTGSAAVSGRADALLVSACNVFWENELGIAGEDYVPGPADRELDPLFCDPVGGDYTLFENSPCLPENSAGCGAIGLFGAGCGVVNVEPQSWGKVKESYRDGGPP